jgi:ligand-binding sensor protein
MGGILTGLTTMLQAIATAFGGTMGIAVVTVGVGGTAIGCLLFHVPMHFLWKAAMVGVVLLGAGAIAQALVT